MRQAAILQTTSLKESQQSLHLQQQLSPPCKVLTRPEPCSRFDERDSTIAQPFHASLTLDLLVALTVRPRRLQTPRSSTWSRATLFEPARQWGHLSPTTPRGVAVWPPRSLSHHTIVTFWILQFATTTTPTLHRHNATLRSDVADGVWQSETRRGRVCLAQLLSWVEPRCIAEVDTQMYVLLISSALATFMPSLYM